EKRMQQLARGTATIIDDVIVPIVAQALRLLVPLIALVLLIPLLNLPEAVDDSMKRILGMLIIGGICYLIIRSVNVAERALLATYRIDVADNLVPRKIYTQVAVVRKIIIVAVVI